jgi:hypothetical protein
VEAAKRAKNSDKDVAKMQADADERERAPSVKEAMAGIYLNK